MPELGISPARAVHPRGGGELEGETARIPAGIGSSPRGRGTLCDPGRLRPGHRFIPAGAGNSDRPVSWRRPEPVHPRGGGELRLSRRDPNQMDGSSPRGRGTQRRAARRAGGKRFIPAGAGNSFEPGPMRPVIAVHPRGGGELMRPTRSPTLRYGSSPRGRGTLRFLTLRRCAQRFIPAGAGNSGEIAVALLDIPVHPRGGGELACPTHGQAGVGGSSPRGRGTPREARRRAQHRRFIPAGAGNSI